MAASAGTDRFELNLTPLLDVVMQLIMFFMMCVNFVNEQVNQNVLLPASTSAQENMAKADSDILVINIEVARVDRKDSAGKVIKDAKGQPIRDLATPRRTNIQFVGRRDIWFTDEQEGAKLLESQRELATLARLKRNEIAFRTKKRPENVKLDASVIIRADAETRYGLVVQLMAQCTKEGFPKASLRALTIPDK